MKKTEMLKKNYQFKNVLSKGKFYIKNEIEIVILKNGKNINLLGIAVGTKNGKAFQRNKAKRLIREAYQRLEPTLTQGNSIIVLIKKNFNLDELKFNSIFNNMKSCFDEAKITQKKEEKI